MSEEPAAEPELEPAPAWIRPGAVAGYSPVPGAPPVRHLLITSWPVRACGGWCVSVARIRGLVVIARLSPVVGARSLR